MCNHGSRLPNTGTWIEGAGERDMNAIVGSSLFFFIVVAVKIDLECQILSQVGRKHCCAAI